MSTQDMGQKRKEGRSLSLRFDRMEASDLAQDIPDDGKEMDGANAFACDMNFMPHRSDAA